MCVKSSVPADHYLFVSPRLPLDYRVPQTVIFLILLTGQRLKKIIGKENYKKL